MKEAQKGFLNWCLEKGWDVDGSVEDKGKVLLLAFEDRDIS